MAGAKPVHLLWALMFMKLYCSESVLAALAGGVHEQTFRKWSWYFVEEIANLQYKVILWSNRFKGDIGNICLVSVDGTDLKSISGSHFGRVGSLTNSKGQESVMRLVCVSKQEILFGSMVPFHVAGILILRFFAGC